ncbi:MAG: hypothetical protein ACYTGL_21430 [Planctomycetota bacterium]|jgi:hypothetical protein
MQELTLQRTLAFAAIMMMPWAALRPLETSFSWGDIVLVMAVILNLGQVQRMYGWQVLMLSSLPLILVSLIMDPEGSVVEVVQALYIFGFVLPFGWIAFIGMRPRHLVTALLLAQSLSSLFAVAQLLGFVDQIGRQSIWMVYGATRSAGLGLSCSALCMSLSSMFPLLLYVKDHRLRLTICSALCLGMFATLAKSMVLAVPGVLWYAYREPNRRSIITLGIVAVTLGAGVIFANGTLRSKVIDVSSSFIERVERVNNSVYERSSTIEYALAHLPRTYLVGMGYAGTSDELSAHLGNTVHVFHIGIILIGGIPAGMLHHCGAIALLLLAWRARQKPVAYMFVAHFLAVCTTTVLMLSFQYVPYVVCAAIADYQRRQDARHELADRTVRHRPVGGRRLSLPGKFGQPAVQ